MANNIKFYQVALSHKSKSFIDKDGHKLNNERLEYLGDSVISMSVADYLFLHYKDASEGMLTTTRSKLVNRQYLNNISFELHIDQFIRKQRSVVSPQNNVYGNTMEAIIGAIYLDQGYDTARAFIEKHILVKIDDIIKEGSWRDPKSFFQEIVQHYNGTTPTYRTLGESGPDHDKVFEVAAFVGNKQFGKGSGHSKQEAQAAAAKQGIAKYRKTHADFDEMVMSNLNKTK